MASHDLAAEVFERMRSERAAEAARSLGGRTPRSLSVGEALPSYRVNGNGTHKRQRIPEPEQLRSFELLRGIRGLDERDARDLAQLGPAADVARAVELLAVACPKPRNCGGWLRRAITDGWAASQQGLA